MDFQQIFNLHFQALGIIIIGSLALLLSSVFYVSRVSFANRTQTTNPAATATTTNKLENDENKRVVAPPEVAGAWPIVGHLPLLVGTKQPLFRVLGDMADEYGPIFMVRFGMYPTLVVSSWEMAKECFTTNDKVLASRPTSAASKYLTYNYAMFGFTFYGPYWREIRKISTLQLLSPRRLELFKHVPYTEIDICIRQLYRLWMKNNGNQIQAAEGGSHMAPLKVDMSQLFGDLTLNVVLKLVVGKRILINGEEAEEDKGIYREDDYVEEGGQKLRQTIEEFFKLTGVSVASDVLPFLGWLDLDGQKKNMKRIAKEIDTILMKWLEEHRRRRRRLTSNEEMNNDDFMDVLLSVFDKDDDSHQQLFINYSRDTVIKATSLNMIVAASDTTSLTLVWALSLLLNNPHVLRKSQDELETKVGRSRHVEERDIDNLVYLHAVVKETLRMYPIGPLSVPHEATEDCNVGGYNVKAGTRVLSNLWKLQRDPRLWSKPSEFRPERFLAVGNDDSKLLDTVSDGEAANMDFRGQHFEYIPFGSGRRMCPGMNFGLQTMHMTLARLLHTFELRVPDGELFDMAEGSGLTMPKVTPLEVLLTPRLPLSLYI